jgi:hypothetical protein
MRTVKFFLVFLLSSILTFPLYAQDGNNIDPDELTEKQLESLDRDVNLDDFQRVELRDFLLESTKKIKTALDNGMDSSDIRFLVENNNREFDAKLKEVLLPEQFEKYMTLKREQAINKDNRKKKKSKER